MFWEDRVSSKCLLLYRQSLCSVNKCIFCILPPSWIYFLLCISTALTFLSHQHHPPILSQQPTIQLACLLLDTNAGTESFVSCRFPDTPSAPKLKPKLPNTGYGFLVDPFKLPLCNPMNCGTPGFPVIHHLWSLVKLMSIESVMPSNQPSSVVPFSSQHQGLLQSVSSSHQVAKVQELQLQHQRFQWTFRTDLL